MDAAAGRPRGPPSQSTVESKLKTESDSESIANATGRNATTGNKLISCVAKALEKDADPSSLQDHVNGEVTADDIKQLAERREVRLRDLREVGA